MAYEAKIIVDSISPDGVRLTTFEVTFPRIVLAEFNTHRAFSRNSASSRAVPVDKMIQRVLEEPYIPSSWGKNQKGMQSEEEVDELTGAMSQSEWLAARDEMVKRAQNLLELGIHKQFTNRLLEPFMWHTVIVTATDWSNFFHLRDNKNAHPDIQIPAKKMRELFLGMQQQYASGTPKELDYGQWHLPYLQSEDLAALNWEERIQVSSAKCARVSYLTHDGKRDYMKDIELHDSLRANGHMSPFEHVARPITPVELRDYDKADPLKNSDPGFLLDLTLPRAPQNIRCGNFMGWKQYRKMIPNEHDILAPRA